LVAPFLVLYWLPINWLVFAYFITALCFFFGISEVSVKIISDTLHLGIYEKIANYAAENSSASEYDGQRLDFFIYTISWAGIFFFTRHLIRRACLAQTDLILKNFLILSFPYFVFGFAAYANRYAVIAWFYLPLIQSSYIVFSKFSNHFKLFLALLALPISVTFYISHFT